MSLKEYNYRYMVWCGGRNNKGENDEIIISRRLKEMIISKLFLKYCSLHLFDLNLSLKSMELINNRILDR